jgi:hypothetical protein
VVLARLRTAAVFGIDACTVHVEVDVGFGFPAFTLVGLPDVSVRESRDRVRGAIRNSGFVFPPHRITVNLAPADVRKEGSSFDLPIALGILAKGQNVAFLVGLAFAIAASANLPALLCTLFWKRTTERGIVYGIMAGLISSILLIVISPTMMGHGALFSLTNPGIVSIPLGFAVTMGVSILGSRSSENARTEKAAG